MIRVRVPPDDRGPLARRFTFESHVGKEGLSEITAEWRALAASLPRHWFHHLPEWYACYLDALEPDASLVRFYAIRVGASLHAIVPLKATSLRVMGRQVSVLTLPFGDHLPFGDIICRPDANTEAIGRALISHLRRSADVGWDLLVLPRVLDGAAAEGLASGVPAFRRATRAQGTCDYITIAGADSTRGFISGKFLRDLRRRRNKLHQVGTVEFDVATSHSALRHSYENFLAVEASGWKGAGGSGTAIALDPRLVAFYRALIDRFAPLDGCEISELRVAGRCAAAQFTLVVDGAWYLLKMGYDESLSPMAPGNLLVEHALGRHCTTPAISEVNLVSDASWHSGWDPASLVVCTHFVANLTLRGIITVAALRVKERLIARRARRATANRAQVTAGRPPTAASAQPTNAPDGLEPAGRA